MNQINLHIKQKENKKKIFKVWKVKAIPAPFHFDDASHLSTNANFNQKVFYLI